MAKYLLLKHYRGAPEHVNGVPMDQWTPEEVDAHITYMAEFADRLVETGEFVSEQALSPEGMWVRSDLDGKTPVTDGPFDRQLTAFFEQNSAIAAHGRNIVNVRFSVSSVGNRLPNAIRSKDFDGIISRQTIFKLTQSIPPPANEIDFLFFRKR